ncbi:MAG TPA: galactokinase family protein [Pyrinomonadaceae bacterium]|nr:galactokinase [Acidobacteriota bacterium]HQZ96427.1 galactokinase family protein [Pyrinomonadaceae bacterium]
MFIPGRIEFLGKHTDYCGGRSVVCAIDRGFHAELEDHSEPLVVLENLDISERISVPLKDPTILPGHWTNYAAEVVRRLGTNFPEGLKNGVKIRFNSDLPKAAGLSSSSALMIMVFAALDLVNDLRGSSRYQDNIHDKLDLAEYLGCVENGQSFRELAGSAGVGTFGGSQDHAAIVLGKADKLSAFSFSPLRHDADFPFPETYSFVVASSGVAAEKTGTARDSYNRISRMVSEVTSTVGRGLTFSRMFEEFGVDEVLSKIRGMRSAFMTRDLLSRVEQFRIENFEIIPSVIEMLAAGRIADIGDAIDISQENAERFLGNQITETSFLQRSAREIGVVAASAFGAGFGGSVYALLTRSDAEGFKAEWQRVYRNRFPQHSGVCEFFTARPSECDLG